LSQGADWQVLSPGISVQGGQCVNANGPNTSPALYIVGGRANSTQSNFPGLQRYVYASQTWETITPEVPVSQNRANHGAAFLNQSSSIVVYAGSQDPSNTNPSSQTFLIATTPPYNVLSFTSIAPPVTQPMLMPWNDTHAVMIGGNDNNKSVWVFSQAGWADLGTSLTQPITNEMTMQCTITTGDDGTKVLEMYNMGVSPNTVTSYLLFANGQPAPPGLFLGTGTPTNGRIKRKRQVTLSNWPQYNATGAPTTTRSGFSIAQAPNGIAVISGGGPANDPIQIFSERQNDWVDITSVFGNQTPLKPTTTASGTPSSTSATSAASTSSSALGPSNKALTVLGGALGGVLGFAAILILILLLLRWHADQRRRKEKERREANEKENRLSFADQGAAFMEEAHGVRGPQGNTDSVVGSISSLQIFGSKSAQNGHRRGQPSDSSQLGLVQHKSPLGANDVEMNRVNNERLSPPSTATRVNSPYDAEGSATGAPLDRSTGWSQYFNNNQNVTNLMPSAAAGAVAGQTFLHGNSARTSNVSGSEYDSSSRHPSNNVRPLDLDFGPRFTASSNPQAARQISTSSYDHSHWSVLSEDRNSHNSSILTAFPSMGSGPAGNAFARPDNPLTGANRPVSPTSSPQPTARDFPMPRAYFPPNPAPPPTTGLPAFPRALDIRRAPESPLPNATPRGPVLRKMTGSEDMSWLNINAPPGRP
jgi:hypothetical protein